jgi:hypothetical protein
LQDASSDAFAERHGGQWTRAAEDDRQDVQRLAGVLTAVALVAAAAGSVLYRAWTRPAPVERVHHIVAAVPPPATAPGLRIVATYPVGSGDAASPVGSSHAAGLARPVLASVVSSALPRGAAGLAAPTAPFGTAAAPRLPIASAGGADALAGVALMAAPAPVAPAAPAVAAPSVRPPDDSIRALLQRYEEAYDHRDARSAAALWPSLDRGALARAFAGLDRQDVEFDRCDIDASGAKGSAVCVGTVRYVPSVGRAVEKTDRITWTFALARSGEDWHIDGLSAR